MTTIDTMTNAQLIDLARAAGEAGDIMQAAICEVAMGATPDYVGLSSDEIKRLRAMSVDQARAVCLDVIRDAEANA